MKTTVVMPAYNAVSTLRETYDTIPKHAVDEVILVDDCSTDGTLSLARSIPGLIVLSHAINKGYGANQKTCYEEALARNADVVVMLHPDMQYDPRRVPAMIAPLQAGTADMVMGSRFLGADPREQNMPPWRYWGNRFLTTIQNWVLGTTLSECHSGYRAYSRRLLQHIPYRTFSDDFAFDAQLLAAVARRSFRVAEVPIATRYDDESSSISFSASVRYGLATLCSLLPDDGPSSEQPIIPQVP